MPSVLIVDDLLSIHEMLEAVIQPTGFNTVFTTDGEKALSRYKTEKFDLVLADIDMKPMDGITLLKQLKQYDPTAVVVIMTGYASIESAIQALKFGAFDYLQKPFRVNELIATLKRGVEFRQFQTTSPAGSQTPVTGSTGIESRIIGKSSAVHKLIQQVNKLSAVRSPVLLQGESGTGKTVVAEWLHEALGAPGAQLVRIDCTQSSEANFREGLLGQNGAGGNWVQQAKGGTLFLQHLENLPLDVQKELVSVLRNTAHTMRLIGTTAEDLERLCDEGLFFDELFYRVAALPVHLPPLRDRIEDIPVLVKHCTAKAVNPNFSASLVELNESAMATLENYHWPGNVAELFQVITKIASTTESRMVTPEQLPLRLREPKHWPKLVEYLARQEKQYFNMVLHACHGDKAKAAAILGVEPERLA